MKFKINGCLIGILIMLLFCFIGAISGDGIFGLIFSILGIIFMAAFSFKIKKRIKVKGKSFEINLTAAKNNTLEKARIILKNNNADDAQVMNLSSVKLAKMVAQNKLRCKQLDDYLETYQPLYNKKILELTKKLEENEPDEFLKNEALNSLPMTVAGGSTRLLDYYQEFKEFDFSVFDNFDFQPYSEYDLSYFDKLYKDKNIYSDKENVKNMFYYIVDYALVILYTYETMKLNAKIVDMLKKENDIDHLDGWEIEPCNCPCCKQMPLKIPFEKTPALPRHIGCTCKLTI